MNRAFYLTDCLMTLLVVMLGTSAVTGLSLQNRRFQSLEQERMVARNLFNNVRQMATDDLDRFGARTYDFFGLVTSAEPKYTIRVTAASGTHTILYSGRLAYVDAEGHPQVMTFERREWRP